MSSTSYKKCEHPLHVKCGKHRLLLLSSRDYSPNIQGGDIAKLNVFIGLSTAWSGDEIKEERKYKNPFMDYVKSMWNKVYANPRPDNIVMLEVPDYGINEAAVTVCVKLLEEGRRIGFGCTGGHGRTGWLYARLLKLYEGLDGDNAVVEVRKRFCVECVESEKQFDDLGCVAIKPRPVPKYEKRGGYGAEINYADVPALYGGKDYGISRLSGGRSVKEIIAEIKKAAKKQNEKVDQEFLNIFREIVDMDEQYLLENEVKCINEERIKRGLPTLNKTS